MHQFIAMKFTWT